MFKYLCSLLAASLLMLSSCSQTTDNRTKVISLFDAINRHDVSEAMTFFAEDVRYIMTGESPLLGKPALRKLFEWDSTLASKNEIGGVWVSGDTVVVDTMVEDSELAHLMGMPAMRSYPGSRFIFEKGLIKTVEYSEFLPEDAKIFRNRATAIMHWFVNTHRERIKEVENRTFFQFSSERASDWLKLAAEWHEWKDARGMLN